MRRLHSHTEVLAKIKELEADLPSLEARLKIKHNYKERISLNHILNCSVTNQGCDGGYSYLVSKFGAEFELIPKSCEAPRHPVIN